MDNGYPLTTEPNALKVSRPVSCRSDAWMSLSIWYC
jgi:hypothetical protein